jgi:hypothetical protein
VDELRKDDIARAGDGTAAERLSQALDTAAAGIALKRDALRVRYPEESEAEFDARLPQAGAWLIRPRLTSRSSRSLAYSTP